MILNNYYKVIFIRDSLEYIIVLILKFIFLMFCNLNLAHVFMLIVMILVVMFYVVVGYAADSAALLEVSVRDAPAF